MMGNFLSSRVQFQVEVELPWLCSPVAQNLSLDNVAKVNPRCDSSV
jgi:hypothetical protein